MMFQATDNEHHRGGFDRRSQAYRGNGARRPDGATSRGTGQGLLVGSFRRKEIFGHVLPFVEILETNITIPAVSILEALARSTELLGFLPARNTTITFEARAEIVRRDEAKIRASFASHEGHTTCRSKAGHDVAA